MDVWGSEFLEDGSYGSLNSSPKYGADVFHVPMDLMDRIVDKRRVGLVISEPGGLDWLVGSISNIGLLEPVELVYAAGFIHLYNGYHRYAAFKQLGYTSIPATFSPIDSDNAISGITLENFLFYYLTKHCEDKSGTP